MTHIWFGDKHSIPGGFQICDGTNGTPDLRDRLVIGAGPHFPFGSFGGASSINLAAAQLAPHTHGAGSLVANANGNHLHHFSTSINEGGHSHGFHLEAASAGEHKHKIDLQTGSAGDHDHTFDAYLPVDYNSGDEMFGVPVDKVDKDESYVQTVSSGGAHEHSVYGYTQMSGSHTHSISGSIGGSSDGKHYHHIDADTAKSGIHDHTVSGATGSTGEGKPINIMNPYHSLYFICCVGKQHKANYY
jgi:microcystin-dependent protein